MELKNAMGIQQHAIKKFRCNYRVYNLHPLDMIATTLLPIRMITTGNGNEMKIQDITKTTKEEVKGMDVGT
jgi:hypothetical protein